MSGAALSETKVAEMKRAAASTSQSAPAGGVGPRGGVRVGGGQRGGRKSDAVADALAVAKCNSVSGNLFKVC